MTDLTTKLSALTMGNLVAIHNLIADAPATGKTFSQRSKAVDRILKIANEKGIDLGNRLQCDAETGGWRLEEPKEEKPQPQSTNVIPLRGGELQAAVEAGIKGGEDQASQSDATGAKPKGKAKKVKSAEAKAPKGPSIRSVAEQLLLQVVDRDEDQRPIGRPYEDVLAELHDKFPGCKTTVACLRWYAVHMRERDVKVPSRPRAVAAAPDAESKQA